MKAITFVHHALPIEDPQSLQDIEMAAPVPGPRDLLVEGLLQADADPGLEIVGHVHDEILALADVGDEGALDRLMDAMRQMPAWAEDAPVDAAGWCGAFYCKQ